MRKSTPVKRKTLARPEDAKQVGNFKMPDAPTSKRKGKGSEPDHRLWIPCPLLPGVPAIPPPRIPQPWEENRSHEPTAATDDHVTEGLPPSLQEPSPGLTKKRKQRMEDVSGTPTTPRAKVRQPRSSKLQKSQVVVADIEFVDLMPTSSISIREALGSDMCVNIERELDSVDTSGSEIEGDEEVLDEPTSAEAAQLEFLDADEDQAIRRMAAGEGDLLNFEWSSDYLNFKGVREKFTGPSGPTFNHSAMSPLQVFEQIWDTSIIDLIVTETNKYARQLQSKMVGDKCRISRWKDTTREEIWRFFSILMLQSLVVNNVEREYWYPRHKQLCIGKVEETMSFNRFLLIKRCLHFADNATLPEHPSKLDKIMPIISHLNEKFGSLYLPDQNIAIDESLLLWKGRLSFSQKIATKRAREGIKSYELCESRTGYLWKMEVYTGKGHVHSPQEEGAVRVEPGQGVESDEPENATSQVVCNLLRPLFGKGHTLVMDNYYNSPLLSRLLKRKHKTDTMGTLRLNREFVPEGLKSKTKKNMKTGEVCFSSTQDICVIVYMDKNVVPMISSYHQPEVGGKVKYGYFRYKPKVILDYNLYMGGIDRKDQLLSSYPMERSRNLCWYKKLFRRLLNVSIQNASIIYEHGRTNSQKCTNRSFRLQLLQDILDKYCCSKSQALQPMQPSLQQMHLPVKVKTNRCKLCYKRGVRRTTVWRCSTCQVNLCIMGCYTDYHKQLCQQ